MHILKISSLCLNLCDTGSRLVTWLTGGRVLSVTSRLRRRVSLLLLTGRICTRSSIGTGSSSVRTGSTRSSTIGIWSRGTTVGVVVERRDFGFAASGMGRCEGQVGGWAEPGTAMSLDGSKNSKNDDSNDIGSQEEPSQPGKSLKSCILLAE